MSNNTQKSYSEGDYVKHKYQNYKGWIVGFEGNKAIVEIVNSEEEDCDLLPYSTLEFFVQDLEHISMSEPTRRKYASLSEDELISQLYGVDNDIEVTQVDKTEQVISILKTILEKYCYQNEYSELEEQLEKALSLLESEVQNV